MLKNVSSRSMRMIEKYVKKGNSVTYRKTERKRLKVLVFSMENKINPTRRRYHGEIQNIWFT